MLKSTKTINDPSRNVPVDIFRSIAIISVILYHFNGVLPYGNLGVELFFVISGLLVSGILIKNLQSGTPVNYFRFILQRGFKIWPSYYTFFLFGLPLAWLFYRHLSPDQIIPLWDLKRYLFFYQNYVPGDFHWSFDHIWSLCVEEHFYILLPIMFIVIQKFFNNKKFLFLFTGAVIFLGITFKPMGFYLTNSHDTVAMTQYRIDALGWGVMLNLLVTFYPEWLKKYSRVLLISGLLLFACVMTWEVNTASVIFHKIVLPSAAPACFFLMISGAYFIKVTGFKVLRFIAYYSYNLYLWHVIFIKFITFHIGSNIAGFILYLSCSGITAVLFTVLVEETVLAKRSAILNKIFRKGYKVKQTSYSPS